MFMWKTMVTHLRAVLCCLFLLATLLLATTACGIGNYFSPNGSPQATPTKGRYSIVWLFDKEFAFVDSLLHSMALY
jgi:hypothetical protein